MRTSSLQLFVVTIGVVAAGCSGTTTISPPPGAGGSQGTGGGASDVGGSSTAGGNATGGAGVGGTNSPTGGALGAGGAPATGGLAATGGKATGGMPATGGSKAATGGSPPVTTGGTPATGGSKAGTGGSPPATGGAATGGKAATGGATSAATGGKATGGATSAATGGKAAGGASTGGGSAFSCQTTMPTGGTDHCGANTQGNAGGLAWSLWSNAVNSAACITTFNTTAFSARWGNSGDFLARVGLEWGNGGKTYDQYGTISADFSYTKTGTGGGYSYIGIYGWSTNPCVEYYIVDDSFNNFPFNAYNATQTGTATIDGEVYKLFRNSTTGTGGSRCSGVSSWNQFWSIRQKARQCGTITITQHFDAWKAAGMALGGMLEAKILVEVGGGTGSINFPVANVTAK